MTKRELIDEIVAINQSASPRFLSRFDDEQLGEYLTHLRILETPRLTGSAERYEKYFRNCPKIRSPRPAWRTEPERVEEIAADDYEEDFEPPEAPTTFEALDDQSVGHAEREQLLAEPLDLEGDLEGDEELEGQFEQGPWPVEAAAVESPSEDEPADTPEPFHAPEAPIAAEEPEENTDDAEVAPPAPAVATVGARTGKSENQTGPLFANSEEDSESWLY